MAQALSAVYLHLVFSTKKRGAYLQDEQIHAEMCAYLGGVSNKLGVSPLLIGGTADHVHVFCRFGRSITVADWVKEMKRTSSIWCEKAYPRIA